MEGLRTRGLGLLLLATFAVVAVAACGGAMPPGNDQTTVTVSPPSSAPATPAGSAPAAPATH